MKITVSIFAGCSTACISHYRLILSFMKPAYYTTSKPWLKVNRTKGNFYFVNFQAISIHQITNKATLLFVANNSQMTVPFLLLIEGSQNQREELQQNMCHSRSQVLNPHNHYYYHLRLVPGSQELHDLDQLPNVSLSSSILVFYSRVHLGPYLHHSHLHTLALLLGKGIPANRPFKFLLILIELSPVW